MGLDFFDASINRAGAYVIGTRATQISFLKALLEPTQRIREYEEAGKGYEKLALMEESKLLPFADVWNYFCLKNNVPQGLAAIEQVAAYEKKVLRSRDS